jgi:hypothetical protein
MGHDHDGSSIELLSKKDQSQNDEERNQYRYGVNEVASKRRHLHVVVFGNAFHHEVRPVADIAVGAHEY